MEADLVWSHGISTQLAHRMHQPANQPLHDIGFSLLPVSNLIRPELVGLLPQMPYSAPSSVNQPLASHIHMTMPSTLLQGSTCILKCFCFQQELGQKNEWVSELIFGSLFASFMLWSFSPFVTAQKRFYTAVLFSRLLLVLVSKYTFFSGVLSVVTSQLIRSEPSPTMCCLHGVVCTHGTYQHDVKG